MLSFISHQRSASCRRQKCHSCAVPIDPRYNTRMSSSFLPVTLCQARRRSEVSGGGQGPAGHAAASFGLRPLLWVRELSVTSFSQSLRVSSFVPCLLFPDFSILSTYFLFLQEREANSACLSPNAGLAPSLQLGPPCPPLAVDATRCRFLMCNIREYLRWKLMKDPFMCSTTAFSCGLFSALAQEMCLWSSLVLCFVWWYFNCSKD